MATYTIEALDDQGEVVASVDVVATGPGSLGTVDSIFTGGNALLAGDYTFRALTPETGVYEVAIIAPTIIASDSLSGRTLTISVDSTTGTPAPTTALTALTLGGVNVLGDETGTGPWSYEVPDSEDSQTVAWTVEASNSEGSDTASGSETVGANLFAPTSTSAPQITGNPAPGSTVTIVEGIYSGSPAPTLTPTLTLDGVDVTANLSGLDYTIPEEASVGEVLEYSETASNGVSPDAQDSVSVAVQAASTTVPATLTDDNVTITPSKYDIELTTDGVKITSSSNIAVVFTTDGLQIQEPA